MALTSPEARERAWERAVDEWLGGEHGTEQWRLSRGPVAGDPSQGWKLHVSATILSAPRALGRAAPVLAAAGARYKVPRTLLTLKRLNCGLFYGHAQVGKFMTVYPRSDWEARELATALSAALGRLPAPAVPYERPCFAGSPVFRRFGAFDSLMTEGPDRRPAVRRPDGTLEEDRRDATPAWAPPDPFGAPAARLRRPGPLATRYRAYAALSQRGKGGVYRALDLRGGVRPCILKEGRRHGEVDWDGTDGRARLEHEGDVLAHLAAAGVPAPAVLDRFREGRHAYLVLEALDGVTLQQAALAGAAKLDIPSGLAAGLQCARLLARLHALGWIWRDCKPPNLILDGGTLRPLDFEGAVRQDAPPQLPWGTAGYVPPEWRRPGPAVRPVTAAQDLYALGSVLHAVLSGTAPPAAERPRPIGVYRRGVPRVVRALIAALHDEIADRRPSAAEAAATLARVA